MPLFQKEPRVKASFPPLLVTWAATWYNKAALLTKNTTTEEGGLNWLGHLRTVNRHRRLVRRACFQAGLYWQGLTHDLSKYSPVEFLVGVRYFQGDHSPNEAERLEKGYSTAWLHHKGRNKHHLEYWIDYSPTGDHALCGCRMPERFVVESFCDRVAASKVYLGDRYTDASAWEYYRRSQDHYLLHPESRRLLEALLLTLRDQGEAAAFRYAREVVKKSGRL